MALLRWQQNIVDDAGNVQAGATVEIRDEASGNLVALFTDRAGLTPKGNPITADANGYAFAYVESGRFKITATNGAFSAEWRDVRLPEDSATIAADAVASHVGEADPHAQYAELAGGAAANFTAMPQVGGDPIVESGSNSDGEWTRWADGTQAVRRLTTIDTSQAVVQGGDSPAAFLTSGVSSAASISGSITVQNRDFLAVSVVRFTANRWEVLSGTTFAGSVPVEFFAFGYWK